MSRTADELHQHVGRSPTSSELAEHLEIGEEEVLEAPLGTAAPAS
jgi:DNA-directed RNA polymerase specialized sigma subunit